MELVKHQQVERRSPIGDHDHSRNDDRRADTSNPRGECARRATQQTARNQQHGNCEFAYARQRPGPERQPPTCCDIGREREFLCPVLKQHHCKWNAQEPVGIGRTDKGTAGPIDDVSDISHFGTPPVSMSTDKSTSGRACPLSAAGSQWMTVAWGHAVTAAKPDEQDAHLERCASECFPGWRDGQAAESSLPDAARAAMVARVHQSSSSSIASAELPTEPSMASIGFGSPPSG